MRRLNQRNAPSPAAARAATGTATPTPILAPVARPPAAAVSEVAGSVVAVVSAAAEGVDDLVDSVDSVDLVDSVDVVNVVEESDCNGVEDNADGNPVDVDSFDVVELSLTTFPLAFKTTPLASSQQSGSLSQQYFPVLSQMVTRGK